MNRLREQGCGVEGAVPRTRGDEPKEISDV